MEPFSVRESKAVSLPGLTSLGGLRFKAWYLIQKCISINARAQSRSTCIACMCNLLQVKFVPRGSLAKPEMRGPAREEWLAAVLLGPPDPP